MMNKHLHLFILSMFILILIQCKSKNNDTVQHHDFTCSEYKGKTVADFSQPAQGLFFAALYHLPATEELYSDKGRWIGQQPDSFYELLSEDEKSVLYSAFLVLLSNSNAEDQEKICRQVYHWGYIYQILSQFGRIYAFEELIAALWQTGKFTIHFEPSIASRGIDTQSIAPIDLAATLSSAEGIDIYLKIVTDISVMDQGSSLESLLHILEHLQEI